MNTHYQEVTQRMQQARLESLEKVILKEKELSDLLSSPDTYEVIKAVTDEFVEKMALGEEPRPVQDHEYGISWVDLNNREIHLERPYVGTTFVDYSKLEGYVNEMGGGTSVRYQVTVEKWFRGFKLVVDDYYIADMDDDTVELLKGLGKVTVESNYYENTVVSCAI